MSTLTEKIASAICRERHATAHANLVAGEAACGWCWDSARVASAAFAEWLDGMDSRAVRDAIRRVQVGPIGQNALQLAQRGGSITLTPDEAERMAIQAGLALAAEAAKGAAQ